MLTMNSTFFLPRRQPVLTHPAYSNSTTTFPLLPCLPSSSSPNAIRTKTRAISDERLSRNKEEEKEEFKVLTAVKSKYNDIVIVDSPQYRTLLLDSTYNVHSIFNKEHKWTGSYWDEFASLPAIVPEGPIAILGLAGGTCARLMLDIWPSLGLEGWEIDEVLIDNAREYLGLSDLERRTHAGGVLCVHVGDALSPSASVPGGFAGIVVDLFSDGRVLPQLQEVQTWLELNKKLAPHGRIMVNCGAATAKTTKCSDGISQSSSNDGLWRQNLTIKSLRSIFQENLSWKRIGGEDENYQNYLALTGPLPHLDAWSAAVPEQLSLNVKQWRPCGFVA